MQIEYVATRSKRTVSNAIGEALIARKIARRVAETRTMVAEVVAEELIEMPERTGKPKRKYKRRDMQAEGVE